MAVVGGAVLGGAAAITLGALAAVGMALRKK